MPDPFGITLKCPKCGAPLTYQHSQGDTHFYRCPTHGRLVLRRAASCRSTIPTILLCATELSSAPRAETRRSHRSYVEPALSTWETQLNPTALLAKITPAQIEDVKLRRAQEVAHSTVDKDLAVLKAFFNWCMLRNLAASNPVRRVRFFNEDNSRLRYLTEDEYSRLLQAAKKIETSPFLAEKIILSVHTGLRRGSLFHLRWDQVDFLSRVLRIPRTKSGRPHALPLNATVLTTLQALYSQRIPDCPYTFAHPTGRNAREPVKDVKNAFRTALDAAGIKDFTWHDLRHTFASWLIMKGASLRSVAELLGHRGLRMVMRYAHLSPAYLSAEVGLLDAPVPPPPPGEKASPKRARKGQRAQKCDRPRAKIVEFPRRFGSSGWTRTSNPPVNSTHGASPPSLRHRNLVVSRK